MAILRRYNVKTKTFEDHVVADVTVAGFRRPLPEISDRQFFQQLAIDGYVTHAEALAAVATGALPAAIEAIVSGIPVNAQFAARMVLSGATRFERNHQLVEVFAAAVGMDTAALDAFWRAASEL